MAKKQRGGGKSSGQRGDAMGQKLGDLTGTLKKLIQLQDAANELAKATKTTAEKSGKENTKEVKKGYMATAKGFPVLGGIFKSTMGAMKGALKESVKLQEQSLGRGMGLQKVLMESSTQQAELGGSLVGFGDAVKIGYEQFESGMRSNNKSTNKLAAYTKATGGNSKQLLSELAANTAGMSMSTEQETALANQLGGLSQTFGMDMQQVTSAIKALGESMRTFKLLGIGAEMQGAAAALGAAVGPAFAKEAGQLVGHLTSAEGILTATMLGINDERMNLLKGEGDATATLLKAVAEGGERASDMYDMWLKGGMDPALAIKKLEQTFGKGVGDMRMQYKEMYKQAEKQGMNIDEYQKHVAKANEISDEFQASWNNFKKQVFSPLTEVIMKWTGAVIDFMAKYQKTFTVIGQGLVVLAAAIPLLISALAAKKFTGMFKSLLGKGGGAAAQGAATGGGKAGGGLIGGLGKGLVGLGRGLKAIGSPKAMKGAVTILMLAAALIPFAFGMSLMKGIGWDTLFIAAGAMAILGLAAAGLGLLAPVILPGALAIAALGASFIPFAYALSLIDPYIGTIAELFEKLSLVNPLSIALLGPALASVGLGLAALAGGSVLTGIASWLSGDDDPIQMLKDIGKAAKPINELANSIDTIKGAESPNFTQGGGGAGGGGGMDPYMESINRQYETIAKIIERDARGEGKDNDMQRIRLAERQIVALERLVGLGETTNELIEGPGGVTRSQTTVSRGRTTGHDILTGSKL